MQQPQQFAPTDVLAVIRHEGSDNVYVPPANVSSLDSLTSKGICGEYTQGHKLPRAISVMQPQSQTITIFSERADSLDKESPDSGLSLNHFREQKILRAVPIKCKLAQCTSWRLHVY